MNPRQLRIPQTANAPQPFEAFVRRLDGPHHTDVERISAHCFHHRQVIDTRVMGQRHDRRVAVAATIGDEHRR